MKQEEIERLQAEVKYRLIDYLKAEKLPYYEPSLTLCPHCNKQAELVSGFMWSATPAAAKAMW